MPVKFVAVHKDEHGNITHFLTDDGRVVPFEEARRMVHEHEIASFTEIYPDGSWEMDLPNSYAAGDNLDDLPSF